MDERELRDLAGKHKICLGTLEKDCNYGAEFDLDKFKDSIEEKKNNWQKDLRPLLSSNPPPFDVVSKKVLEIVTAAMK
ncbi:MAG: hypothetical protein ACYDAJ_10820 [Nitrosotalea sp.]